MVAQVREELREAVVSRERGDMTGTLEKIQRAMERLANLGAELDPAEGAMMREIARIFMQSLNFGEKGAAKDVSPGFHGFHRGFFANLAGDYDERQIEPLPLEDL